MGGVFKEINLGYMLIINPYMKDHVLKIKLSMSVDSQPLDEWSGHRWSGEPSEITSVQSLKNFINSKLNLP